MPDAEPTTPTAAVAPATAASADGADLGATADPGAVDPAVPGATADTAAGEVAAAPGAGQLAAAPRAPAAAAAVELGRTDPPLPPPVMTAAELDEFLGAAFPGVAARTYRVEAVTATGVTMRLPVGPEHERPGGTVSGPSMMALADVAAWLATLSRIGPVALAVTSNLSINFLRKPGLDADLVADTTVLRLGRRSSVCDVRIVSDPGGRLVAQATVTYAIPAGPGPATPDPTASGSADPGPAAPGPAASGSADPGSADPDLAAPGPRAAGGPSATARRVAAHRRSMDRPAAPWGGDPATDERLAEDVAASATVDPSTSMGRYLRARTAFFDRTVIEAIDAGTTQLVTVAAGYDGRAWRYGRPGVRWWELDLPATQADKLARLARLGAPLDAVRYVAADVTADDVAACLGAAGVDPELRSLVLVEGLLVYLDVTAVAGLLAALRRAVAAGSTLALSVSTAGGPDHAERRAAFERFVEALGEPALSDLDADSARGLLEVTGWAMDGQEADVADHAGESLRSAAGLVTATAR